MKRLFAVLASLIAFGLVLAACGDDDDNGDSAGGGETAAETAAETPTEADPGGGAAAVSMKDIQFDPKTASVPVGGTVTWKNDDSVGHDVTADDDSFKSGDPGGMKQGDTYEFTFKDAGTFKYVCTVHPGMEGTVSVK